MGSIRAGDLRSLGGFYDGLRFGFGPGPPVALVEEKEKLVRSPPAATTSSGKRVAVGRRPPDGKTATALKSHSEAERRRRERINANLAMLRSMVPCTEKLDKAALLVEVINNVKELKKSAVEVSKVFTTLPSDADEVRVEVEGDITNRGSFIVKASICCEDKPELLAELKQSLQGLKPKMIRAEISTLGRRTKNVFVMKYEGSSSDIERQLCVTSVHQVLKSILDRVNSEMDFLPRTSFSSKRRGISYFESSSSS